VSNDGRRHLGTAIAVVAAIVAATSVAGAGAATAATKAVHVTATSSWSPPSPDPAGIAYVASARRFVVVDCDVDELALWQGANVWSVAANGSASSAWSARTFTSEPSDVASKNASTLMFSDDSRKRIVTVNRGADGVWGTADDVSSAFSTTAFGSNDPEGLAHGGGSLFVADGNGRNVYRLTSGPNKAFDGVAPAGDDVLAGKPFNTTSLGLTDPEGITYDAATGHLFLVSTLEDLIVEATTRGARVATYDISSAKVKNPGGIAIAPASNGSGVPHAYVIDRGTDSSSSPGENDGRLFEFALG
jgi:hypothetical protein